MKLGFPKKIEGAITGVYIGDALGLPFEHMKTKQIDTIFTGGYAPIKHHNKIVEFAKSDKTFRYSLDDIGIISDDAQLTIAGLESLIEAKKIDIANLFSRHKKIHGQYGGYGFSGTMHKKLQEYDGGSDLSVFESGFASYGNGVMMKQLPYALYYYVKYFKSGLLNQEDIFAPAIFDSEISEITSITHRSPVAILASLLHNKMLLYLLSHSPESLDLEKCFTEMHNLACLYEQQFAEKFQDQSMGADAVKKLSPLFEKLLQQVRIEKEQGVLGLKELIDRYVLPLSTDKNKPSMMAGYHVATTMGLVYGLFAQGQTFYELIKAIRIGYDTDSQASIIGGMIGALRGPFYNESYVLGLKDEDTLRDQIKRFISSTYDF